MNEGQDARRGLQSQSWNACSSKDTAKVTVKRHVLGFLFFPIVRALVNTWAVEPLVGKSLSVKPDIFG